MKAPIVRIKAQEKNPTQKAQVAHQVVYPMKE